MNLLTPSHDSGFANMPHTFTPAAMARSLVEQVRSLGVVSQNDVALKRYADDLLGQLRGIDGEIGIEEYSGDGFLSLISRLNQEVAPYLLQQGTATKSTHSLRVWVIHKAHLLTTEQQSIIFRLIELFPALPFRVIWLSAQPLQAWNEHAKTECIFLDLDGSPQPDPMSPTVEADPLDWAAPIAEPLQNDLTPDGLPWPVTRPAWHFKAAVALGAVGILGALAWMSSSAPVADIHKPITSTPIADTTEKMSPSASHPAPMASASAPTTSPQVSASSPSITEPSRPNTPAPTISPAPQEARKVSPKPLPDVAQSGGRWLKSLPADTFVIEYGTWGTLEQCEKFKAKHKELNTARIIAMRKPSSADEWQFMVITGPFRSEERAKTYLSRQDKKTVTRIRSTDKLKSQIAP